VLVQLPDLPSPHNHYHHYFVGRNQVMPLTMIYSMIRYTRKKRVAADKSFFEHEILCCYYFIGIFSGIEGKEEKQFCESNKQASKQASKPAVSIHPSIFPSSSTPTKVKQLFSSCSHVCLYALFTFKTAS